MIDEGDRALAFLGESGYEPPVRSPHNKALTKDLWVSDFVLEARLNSTEEEYGHRDMVLFYHWQDPAHFYFTHIASAADPHAHSIFLVDDAPRVSIATERTEGVSWGDEYHAVRVVRDTERGTIEVFFDDMSFRLCGRKIEPSPRDASDSVPSMTAASSTTCASGATAWRRPPRPNERNRRYVSHRCAFAEQEVMVAAAFYSLPAPSLRMNVTAVLPSARNAPDHPTRLRLRMIFSSPEAATYSIFTLLMPGVSEFPNRNPSIHRGSHATASPDRPPSGSLFHPQRM